MNRFDKYLFGELMKGIIKIFSIVFLITIFVFPSGKKTITFKSEDGVTITADIYMAHDKTAPFILLFHQAGWSRGEYIEIAPKLNSMGFNCIAIDQRSGNGVNGVKNMTKLSAEKMNKGTSYIDALTDIESAISYSKQHFVKGKLIIWGSSYSAALVLKFAGDNPKTIDGVLSFSPGEYFEKAGKSKTYIIRSAKNITCPVFITSAKAEKENWWSIYNAIASRDKTWFLPKTQGNHGSRALFEKFDDSKAYWDAVKSFLGKYFGE